MILVKDIIKAIALVKRCNYEEVKLEEALEIARKLKNNGTEITITMVIAYVCHLYNKGDEDDK